MERKRKPKQSRTRERKIHTDEKIAEMTTSILDIPDTVLTDIVLRLPVKAIIMCKCVCKPWRRVISDPHFAEMHFARAEPCPLIRASSGSKVSRMLYLVEHSEINVSYNDENYSCPEYEDAVNLKLDTRLKIPLRNVEMVPRNSTNPKSESGFKRRCIKVTAKEHKFQIVNSCNGFLCLSHPLYNYPLVVCNPVTGEYLNIPGTCESNERTDYVCCGLGYSERSNQFKIFRISDGESLIAPCPITGEDAWLFEVAEVLTLGTSTWRRIGHAPYCGGGYKLTFLTCVGGSIYWLNKYAKKVDLIHSFDFNEEKFRGIKPPPFADLGQLDQSLMTLGMLGGRLSLCTGLIDMKKIQIWTLEATGECTWKCFKTVNLDVVDRWPLGSYLPINFCKDKKGLLMFQSPKIAFIYASSERDKLKYFRIHATKAKYEAVAHNPSFVLLRDVIKGDSVEILNTNSRYLSPSQIMSDYSHSFYYSFIALSLVDALCRNPFVCTEEEFNIDSY
ncbi:OLC1v1025214C1 [Oldenlandia corymbosa var. corymbosa]|uniref:OLC1v1025214C1 n=1 Tax=Oldenlandia corymbosa var. corymbosa TaxID=529605 RepID=A0AAV1C488_OLDCO|nr:OLC1v1025214C1 [Oldenlandia corymbosa var. corymbosa]